MERLTHKRVSGIRAGYWSPNKKQELVDRLAGYEDTGLDPEQIEELKERDTGVKSIFLDGWYMCANCGEHLLPSDRFCSECGWRIKRED